MQSHGHPLVIKHCNGIFPIEMWFLMGKPIYKGGIRHEKIPKIPSVNGRNCPLLCITALVPKNTPDLDTSIAILGDQQSSCCGKHIYGDLFCVYSCVYLILHRFLYHLYKYLQQISISIRFSSSSNYKKIIILYLSNYKPSIKTLNV